MRTDSIDEFDPLHTALLRIATLPGESWLSLRRLVTRQQIRPGMHVLRAGERATKVIFIRSGLLREYYVDDSGREFTRRFCDAQEFSGSLADLLVDRGALVSIEALEASEVWALSWQEVDGLAQRDAAIVALLRRVVENLYMRKVEREYEMLALSARQRYERFVTSHPTLAERVPRHLIASYLGITAVHLSRIATAARSTRAQAGKTERT